MTNNNFDIREWRMQQALKEFNELSDKQKKIASAAEPKDKITGDDFKALRTAKKSMKEQPIVPNPTGPNMSFDAEDLEEDDWKQPDDESDMAHSQLRAVKDLADKLCNMIDDGEQLDAWVQSKLTKAEDYLNSVYRYLAGEEEEEMDNMPSMHSSDSDVILGAQFYEGRGDTDYKRARDAKRFGKKGEKNTFGAGVAKGEKIEKAKLRRK
jgi:hypothetical protein